jgi:hypothetical protein
MALLTNAVVVLQVNKQTIVSLRRRSPTMRGRWARRVSCRWVGTAVELCKAGWYEWQQAAVSFEALMLM